MATIGSTRRSLLIAAMVAAAFLAQLAAGQTLSARSSSASSRFAVEDSDDDDTVVASRPTAGADDDDSIDGRRASYSSKNKNKYTSTYNNKNTKKTDKKKDCVRFAGSCYYDSDCCDSDLRCHDRKCLRGCSQEAGFCQSDIDCCSTDEHPLACNKTSSVCVKRSDCNRFNETCAADGDCCDSKLVCDKNRCLKGCNEKDDACKSDADCCSTALNPLSCNMTTHTCVDEPMCLMFGAECDVNPEAGDNKCCEPLWCEDSGGPSGVCLNGCTFDGDCKSDADCCSTDAAPLTCISNICEPLLECQRFNDTCSDDKDCCDSTLKCLEVMDDNGVKLMDGASYERSVAGGAAASSGGDVSTYARGSSPPAAGGRSLLYQSGTITKCLRGCNMEGGMCFSNFDCCSDTENTLVCNNATNMCEVDPTCAGVGETCAFNNQCCSTSEQPLACRSSDGECCVELGGECGGDVAECCGEEAQGFKCERNKCCLGLLAAENGVHCTSSNDCCQDVGPVCDLDSGRCCRPLGMPTDDARFCCTGEVNGDDECCIPLGDTCSADGECCDGGCNNSTHKCCKTNGGKCDANSECCGGACQNGYCCTLPAGACDENTDCCGNADGGDNAVACAMTSSDNTSPPPFFDSPKFCCLRGQGAVDAGLYCSTAADCCPVTPFCDVVAGKCCKPNGVSCTQAADGDCCSGKCSEHTDMCCAADAGACLENADCCSNSCNALTHTCNAGACTVDDDCAAGQACVGIQANGFGLCRPELCKDVEANIITESAKAGVAIKYLSAKDPMNLEQPINSAFCGFDGTITCAKTSSLTCDALFDNTNTGVCAPRTGAGKGCQPPYGCNEDTSTNCEEETGNLAAQECVWCSACVDPLKFDRAEACGEV